MSKTLKYSLLGIVIIVIAAGGWIYYLFNIKTYDTEDAKVSEVTDKEYVVDLPVLNIPSDLEPVTTEEESDATESSTEVDSDESNDGKEEQNSTSNQTDSSNNSSNEDPANNNSEPNKSTNDSNSDSSSEQESESNVLTATEINRQYKPAFESLESQATDRLNNLLTNAYDEYREKKENDEKISYSYFYQKYKSGADRLEENTDQAFEQLYKALQKDLKENGHSEDEASEFKEEYEAAKESRKDAILDKVREIL
ncbi:hypothetical protein [Aquibacillus sediminis]|uniref:hypothetical protein n=1 Tax=Aquibacillus sediminis TaxID=2574734 RepID=UPI001109AB04|nr:hypothetical protein [Aquibacillus sediminis]